MPLPELMQSIRTAAGFLSPSVWTDSPHQSPDEMARSLQLADIWLTPAVVKHFAEEDFVFLPPEERTRLRESVERFRSVAESVPGDAPATTEQVNTALPELLTILKSLHPYIADPEAETISRAIWQAWSGFRGWIPSYDFMTGVDSTGDPAVWVWLILNDDVDIESADVQQRLARLRDEIHARLRQAGITRWPYITVRTRSETKEMLARGAA